MAQKVLYFTAGQQPTEGELADIAALNAASLPQYETLVVNGAVTAEYGEDRLIPCDFVAGSIPEAYDEIDEIDPDAIPNAPLLETEAIVSDGEEIALDDSNGTVELSVADFEITGAVLTLPATKAIVEHEDEFAVTGGTVTVSVVDGVVTMEFTADP